MQADRRLKHPAKNSSTFPVTFSAERLRKEVNLQTLTFEPMKTRIYPVAWTTNKFMKCIELTAVAIFATLLAGGTYYSHAQDAALIAQQAYLKASNSGANDWFGGAVALSGDTMVVGAFFESSNATGVNGDQNNNSAANSGAAYVFVRDGTNWTQQAYLKASNTGANDNFGWSVAISGDTVVVGAPQESSNATGVNGDQGDNSAPIAGAAYVFVRSGTNWSQQAYLKPSNSGPDYNFGSAVAVSGDTVVIAAPGESSDAMGINGDQSNTNALYSGAAYVFVRSGTNWSQQAYLKASNTGPEDIFASAVAISGDTVIVCALGEDSNATGVNGNQSDNSATDSGAAYVFVRSGTNWTQQAYLKASNAGAGDLFGVYGAVSGDTLVVAAPHEGSNATGVNGEQSNNSAADSGAVYVFVRSGTNWIQQAYLKASNTGAGDNFGEPVEISGDTLVVGAEAEDSNATGVNGNQSNNSAANSGAAYVFVRNGTNWSQQAYLKASNTGANDDFGASVAISGGTVVVSALLEDSNATGVNGNQSNDGVANSGAAYVFTGFGPPAPQLVIEQSAGSVRILWPLSAADFLLEETDDLNPSPTVGWTQAPFPYQTNASHVSITLPLAVGSKFYRLRKP